MTSATLKKEWLNGKEEVCETSDPCIDMPDPPSIAQTPTLKPGIYNWQGTYIHEGETQATSFTMIMVNTSQLLTGYPYHINGYGKDSCGPYTIERVCYNSTSNRMTWVKRYGNSAYLNVNYRVQITPDNQSMKGTWDIDTVDHNVFAAKLVLFAKEPVGGEIA